MNDNASKIDELDSLLDSMGGDDDETTDDVEDHAFLDPDACDFTPFLQTHEGTAMNYHDESEQLTHHHEMLHRANSRPSSPSMGSPSKGPYNFQPPSASDYTTSRNNTSRPEGLWNVFYTRIRQILCAKLAEGSPDRILRYVVWAILVGTIYLVALKPSSSSQATDSTSHDPSQTLVTNVEKHNLPAALSSSLVPQQVQDAYANVDELPLNIMDTPIYWHIPRSGGTTMKLIMSMCMGRTVACEQGAGHQLDEQLELINKPFGNFANVDTSTQLGLNRATQLGLIPSRMVDVVLTPHVVDATILFDKHHRGRLFTLLRHPVDRVVSLYYFLRMPDQEATLGLNVRQMTLEEFARDVSENWMVRSLTSTMSGDLTDEHLAIAKDVLKFKFLIGLLDQKTESLRRFETYFGWKLPSRVSQTCKNNMFYFEPQSKNIHEEPTEAEYEILAQRNEFDMQLYEYAIELFENQSRLIPSK